MNSVIKYRLWLRRSSAAGGGFHMNSVMKYRLKAVAVFAVCCGAILLPAWAGAQEFKKVTDPDAVYRELRQNSERINSLEAQFREVKYLSYLKEPQKSSGRFVYEKKDKMRWEQVVPASYVILINGSSLRVNDGGKEKNVKSAGPVAGMVREMLLMMVNGDYQNSRGFEKELYQNSAHYLVVMKPLEKRLKQRFERLEMQFSKNGAGLRQLTFFEKGGDRQVMSFHDEKINGAINQALFTQF